MPTHPMLMGSLAGARQGSPGVDIDGSFGEGDFTRAIVVDQKGWEESGFSPEDYEYLDTEMWWNVQAGTGASLLYRINSANAGTHSISVTVDQFASGTSGGYVSARVFINSSLADEGTRVSPTGASGAQVSTASAVASSTDEVWLAIGVEQSGITKRFGVSLVDVTIP
jgi:hypothetical protein